MIAIPNMDKPKECIECEFSCLWVNGSTHCMVDGEELFCDGIPQRHDCPLIEIVQCKDCKWGDTGIDEEGKLFWKCLGIHYGGTRPTDFCSYGERRAERQNCKECELADKCDHHICLKAVRERRNDEHNT